MPNVDASIHEAKQAVRERVWALLERDGAVEPGVSGHIPAFVGAASAADLLTTIPSWESSRVIKSNPDRAQLPVRVRALETGKTVYMAVPNLATADPFYLLEPTQLPSPVSQAASHQAAATLAPTVPIETMPSLDLVVCGSVAVNTEGARIGKGAGYSDLELALLTEAGLIDAHTTIVTTVHPLQVVDGPLPETSHDFRVDAVITPDAIIFCPSTHRPEGLVWERLTQEQIAAIPALNNYVRQRSTPEVEQRWT